MELTLESFSSSGLQDICGFSCDDLTSMFTELKGLGVVVKQLSNELRQVVRIKSSCLMFMHVSLYPVSHVMPNICSSVT